MQKKFIYLNKYKKSKIKKNKLFMLNKAYQNKYKK